MNQTLQQLLDQVRGGWRFRWWGLLAAVIVACAGWVVVFALPDRYEATTQVLVDTRTALKPALQGLTMDQDVNVQLDYVRQSLLVDPKLCEIVMKAGMLPNCAREPGAAQIPLADLRNHIKLSVQNIDDRSDANNSSGTIFGITFQDESRPQALQVVKSLLDTLVNDTLGGKRQGSENAQQFLESQIKDYERRLRASEDSLAAFKSKHLGLLPSDDGGYFAQLQKETEAVEDTKTKLLTALNRRTTLEGQLRGNAAVLASTSMSTSNGNGGSTAIDTASQIAQTQAHLDELLLNFTEKHPDVIATRAALAELKKRRAAEIESLRNGDAAAAAASGASSNPLFQSIQLNLNQVGVEIADLQTQLVQHEAKTRDLRELLNSAPQVEAEYAQLTRDYDVNKTQYTALLSNYDKSKLGQRADDAGSVRFQLVQPPTVSYKPISPHRFTLLSAVLLAALAAGVGLAYGLDQLNPVVGSGAALTKLTGVIVLAEIGPAFPTQSQANSRRQFTHVAIVMICLVCAFAVEVSISRAGVRLSIPTLRHLVHEWV